MAGVTSGIPTKIKNGDTYLFIMLDLEAKVFEKIIKVTTTPGPITSRASSSSQWIHQGA